MYLKILASPLKLLKASIKIGRTVQMEEGKKQILIGILVSLPLLVILIILLSSADMVFGYYFANLTEIFNNINIEEFVPHTIIILFITFYLFGYVWSFKSEEKAIEKGLRCPCCELGGRYNNNCIGCFKYTVSDFHNDSIFLSLWWR